ncbi:MAG: TlpA family protein disulfide reductase [Chlorobi bacterium]|nr:TlpA family protein disulfide reductase [Chlorobiota bacterium]
MLKRKWTKWKQKKSGAKISDILFIVFVILLLIPSTRIEVMGFVNRVKAKIIQPGIKKEADRIKLSASDYNWSLMSLENGNTNFNEFKGKVVFLNFWATWCPPCVGELPEIQKLYNKYKNNDSIVFCLVSNESPTVINSFVQKRNYSLPVFIPYQKTPAVFSSRSIPISFLISKNGEIVIKEKGAVNWSGSRMEKIINKLLNE